MQRIENIHLRDPFILPVPEERKYYLFGTGWTLPDGPGFMVYESPDMETWSGPSVAFQHSDNFWADQNYWAPEVHKYKGRYYLFGSFKAEGVCRGTQILVSDRPEGPYKPLTSRPVTPEDWECLDGTLYIDDSGKPWMVFCHEWVQAVDGEMSAIQLKDDLTESIGEPILLFRASEAPWVMDIGKERIRGKVTDGPFFHRMEDGSLNMIWSSFDGAGYCLAVARSESGELAGPWEHPQKPIYDDNGGHGMLFRTFAGELCLILHQPNGGAPPVPTIIEVVERDGMLAVRP